MQSQVIAVGNIVADFIATNIRMFPEWGEHVETRVAIEPIIGGNAANFAICLTKLGINTALIGKVGRDTLGRALLNSLRKKKINVSNVSFCEIPTSVSLIASNLQGERGVIHYIGANSNLKVEDITLEKFPSARILHLSAYYLVPDLEGKPAEEILKKAKELGLVTTFDVAWDVKGLWNVNNLLEFVDFFLPNEKEAEMITGKADPAESASALLDMGVGTAVIKLGPMGCLIKTCAGEEIHVPSYRVPVVDTTGAGDAFDAGFIYGVIKKWSLNKAAHFANAVAAATLQSKGTTSAPTLRSALKMLDGKYVNKQIKALSTG